MHNPRKQFERGRFARPVRAEERHELTCLDIQINAADGLDLFVLAMKESAKRGRESLLLLINAVRLPKTAYFDDRHRWPIIRGHAASAEGSQSRRTLRSCWPSPPARGHAILTQQTAPIFQAARSAMSLIARMQSKFG